MTFTECFLLATLFALCVGERFSRRRPRFCPDCKEVQLHKYRDLEQFQGSCTYATCPACGKHVHCGSQEESSEARVESRENV